MRSPFLHRASVVACAALLACCAAATSSFAAPKVGSWVSYTAKNSGTPDDNSGNPVTIKVLVTGQEGSQFWYEVVTSTGEASSVVKVLADPVESPDLRGLMSPWTNVTRLITQNRGETPKEVPEGMRPQHLPKVVPAFKMLKPRDAKVTKGPEVSSQKATTVTAANKKLKLDVKRETRTEESTVNLGFIMMREQADMTLEVGANPDIPVTGVGSYSAKVIMQSENQQPGKDPVRPEPKTVVSELTLTDFGLTGAETQIKGTPEEMKAGAFPFHLLKPQAGPDSSTAPAKPKAE